MQHNTSELHCVTHALTLGTIQCDIRIDIYSILAFFTLNPCAWSQKIWLETEYFYWS